MTSGFDLPGVEADQTIHRYGGHILNQLDLRSIIECPGGMSTIQCTRSVFTRAFRSNFS